MSNSQIRYESKEKTKTYFDHLFFPTIVSGFLSTISAIIPIFGAAFTSPFRLHVYELCNNPEDYPRFSWSDFKKFFKSHWNVCLGFYARSFVYVALLPVLIWIGCFIFQLLVSGIALSSGGFRSFGFVAGFNVLIMLAYFGICIFAVYRSFRTSLGLYIIYKKPSVTSQEALDTSIQFTKGKLLRFIGMHICLIPQYILTLFAGYGTPFVLMATTRMYDDFCNEGGDIKSELVCPECGASIVAGSKFCQSCGKDLSK